MSESDNHRDLNSPVAQIPSLRQRLYTILELEHHGVAKLINIVLMLVIAFTLIIVFIETIPSISQQYFVYFSRFEVISIILFTIEYLGRIWSAAEINPKQPWKSRWRYMRTPLAIIDLLAILPFYLGLFIQIDARYLRVVRLLRVFKLTRYSRSLNTLLQVLRNELPGIISALSILIMLIILASSLMYLVEHKTQPEAFGSIPQAMWWATITLTTVGYGDVVPLTILGKSLGIIITILGIGIAALPAGIIASGFTSEMQSRRDEFRAKIALSLADDGLLSATDRHDLQQLRIQLGLSKKESESLIHIATSGYKSTAFSYCPHCGENISGHNHPQ